MSNLHTTAIAATVLTSVLLPLRSGFGAVVGWRARHEQARTAIRRIDRAAFLAAV